MNQLPSNPLPPVATEPTPTLVPITDRDLIIYLIYLRIPWADKKRVDSRKTIFFYQREKISEYMLNWQTGQPIPCNDIREIFRAERAFNSAVHDEV